ncbi:MAG: hypothetical protein ABSF87_20580, partial [Xanthobacteraceae bacterium]
SRNDDAQSSSVVSTDAPAIHDPPNHGGPWIQKSKENATVMLVLKSETDLDTARTIMGAVEENCFISNSITAKVKLAPQFRVRSGSAS